MGSSIYRKIKKSVPAKNGSHTGVRHVLAGALYLRSLCVPDAQQFPGDVVDTRIVQALEKVSGLAFANSTQAARGNA